MNQDNYEASGVGRPSFGSPITLETNISLKSANKTGEDGGWSYGKGSDGSTTLNIGSKASLYSNTNKRGRKNKTTNLSATGDVELFNPRHKQGDNFNFSKSYATGLGTSGSTNIQNLFTQEEKDAFSSDLTTRPKESKINLGLEGSYSLGNRRSKTTLSGGVGGSIHTTGSHLKGSDAGISKIHRKFDATSGFNTGDQDSYSNTYGRGNTEIFSGGTANNFGGSSQGGVWGQTSSGDNVFFGGSGTAGSDYFDKVDQYGKSESKENTGIKTYKKQKKSTSFKPYANVSLTREWGGMKDYTGKAKVGFGTKHSTNSGFSGSIGIKNRRKGWGVEVGGSKRGGYLGLNYQIGRKK